jgi:hypothetical protein
MSFQKLFDFLFRLCGVGTKGKVPRVHAPDREMDVSQ